mgnify:CR=1 FL=1
MKIKSLFNSAPIGGSPIVRPIIIAEAGVNHEGSLDLAKRLIDEAKEGGADAIKFQTYRADTIASKNSPAYWDLDKEPTANQHKLFKRYDKFWKDEFVELKNYCDKVDIEFLSTPFDLESARFLNDLMDVFKVSSSDMTNKPFIEYICDLGRPVILSTGASNLDEIKEAAEWVESKDNPLALLHCILNYPTKDENANLAMILGLKKNFPRSPIGYSDHTLPGDMKNLETAVLLGASIVEKHFTYDKTLPGNDHYHAMDKEDLKNFIANLDNLFQLLGDHEKHSNVCEEPARTNARRSLVAKREIKAGQQISLEDVTWKRPGTGISPKDIQEALKHKAARDLAPDSIFQWSDLVQD